MQVSGQTMIFRDEHDSLNGKWYSYSAGISSKRQDGTYVNAYMPVRFRKGVVVENKAKINVKDGFFTVREYESKGEKKKVIELMVLNFDDVAQDKNETGFSALSMDDVPF